jgi:putative nucleotidyltransferase with HDIG domain
LRRIRYAPEKSDCEPIAASARPYEVPEPQALLDEEPAYVAKRAMVERLASQEKKIEQCEREFLNASRSIKAMSLNVFSAPKQVTAQATALINRTADVLMGESEVAIHLISDSVGGDDVYSHALNVALLSMIVAKEMKLSAEEVRIVGLGALFHDVGKTEIPLKIKTKIDPLTKAEAAIMQEHCKLGVAVGRQLELPLESVLVIAQHHERVDNSGYPGQLGMDKLSIHSRIVAVAEAYDEMCNPINPDRSLTPHEVLSIIYAQQRSQFDPVATATLVRCLGVYPPGTIVQLSNGAMGRVVSVNTSRPLKPVVLIYDPAMPKGETILVDLAVEQDVTISRTYKPRQLPVAAYEFLAPGRRTSYYFRALT